MVLAIDLDLIECGTGNKSDLIVVLSHVEADLVSEELSLTESPFERGAEIRGSHVNNQGREVTHWAVPTRECEQEWSIRA